MTPSPTTVNIFRRIERMAILQSRRRACGSNYFLSGTRPLTNIFLLMKARRTVAESQVL